MGVFLGASTQIIDRDTRRGLHRRVPEYAVVVPGRGPPGRWPTAHRARRWPAPSSSRRWTSTPAPRPASTNCCAISWSNPPPLPPTNLAGGGILVPSGGRRWKNRRTRNSCSGSKVASTASNIGRRCSPAGSSAPSPAAPAFVIGGILGADVKSIDIRSQVLDVSRIPPPSRSAQASGVPAPHRTRH